MVASLNIVVAGILFESSYRTETGKDFTAAVLKNKGIRVLLANIKANIILRKH